MPPRHGQQPLRRTRPTVPDGITQRHVRAAARSTAPRTANMARPAGVSVLIEYPWGYAWGGNVNKQIAAALLAAVFATGCATGSDIVPMGHDTYSLSQSGPATGAGFSPLTQTADSAAKQYCASRHETMSLIKTTNKAEIQDPQGGLFAGGVSGSLEVDVLFQCSPATGAH